MRRRDLLIAACALLIATLIAGCGGGNRGNTGGRGSIAIGVRFPTDGQDAAAKIPTNANSVRVQVLAPATGKPLVPDTILNKPPGGGVAQATVRGVPAGPVIVRAIAHPQSDGGGPALADAEAPATVLAERTTTVTLSLVAIVDRIAATPDHLVMLVGEKAQIIAQALDAVGATLIGVPLGFSSDSSSVAEVDADGLVQANALGSTSIHVRHAPSGKQAIVTVDVVEARIVRVEVSVTPPATVIGHIVQFAARAYDDLGRLHPGARFDWRVASAGDGVVDASGRFKPSRVGLAHVIATERSSGVEGTGMVTVADWVVLLNWRTGTDPDLHLFDDSQTNHAYFGHPDVPVGTLLADEIAGPGVEAFAGTRSVPGRYPLAVNYFRGRGDLQGDVTLLVTDRPDVTAPVTLTVANGDDGYPVTAPTASWARPFDVIVSAGGAISSAAADTLIALGPPGSRGK